MGLSRNSVTLYHILKILKKIKSVNAAAFSFIRKMSSKQIGSSFVYSKQTFILMEPLLQFFKRSIIVKLTFTIDNVSKENYQ